MNNINNKLKKKGAELDKQSRQMTYGGVVETKKGRRCQPPLPAVTMGDLNNLVSQMDSLVMKGE
jgi:hypothetical protein